MTADWSTIEVDGLPFPVASSWRRLAGDSVAFEGPGVQLDVRRAREGALFDQARVDELRGRMGADAQVDLVRLQGRSGIRLLATPRGSRSLSLVFRARTADVEFEPALSEVRAVYTFTDADAALRDLQSALALSKVDLAGVPVSDDAMSAFVAS
jgi:hypothetical protein